MARTNITVPEEVLARARVAGLNVSALATAAVVEALDRQAKVAALDAYLAALDEDLGPVSAEETAAAVVWADGVERQLPGRSTHSVRAG